MRHTDVICVDQNNVPYLKALDVLHPLIVAAGFVEIVTFVGENIPYVKLDDVLKFYGEYPADKAIYDAVLAVKAKFERGGFPVKGEVEQ